MHESNLLVLGANRFSFITTLSASLSSILLGTTMLTSWNEYVALK